MLIMEIKLSKDTLDTLKEAGIKCIKMQSIDKQPSKHCMVNNWTEILNFFKLLEK